MDGSEQALRNGRLLREHHLMSTMSRVLRRVKASLAFHALVDPLWAGFSPLTDCQCPATTGHRPSPQSSADLQKKVADCYSFLAPGPLKERSSRVFGFQDGAGYVALHAWIRSCRTEPTFKVE